jgi:SagB-type dehydrogenase family enzyme
MSRSDATADAERVRAYHELSKHHPDRTAPGPGGLDWANQPDPFRRFAGSTRLELPLPAERLPTRMSALRRPHGVGPAPLDLAAVATLLELSFGLSAWKSYGPSRWALRCNPSSGNLHPTEAYCLCPDAADLPGGVHHYHSHDHVLEQRARPADAAWSRALAGNLLIGLSSVHWREAWKYGVRAWRYCQHDAGHALAGVRYAAAALGWDARLLNRPGDAEVAALLGLDREADFEGAEPEAPDALLAVGPAVDRIDIDRLLDPRRLGQWRGRANRLSEARRHWAAIDEVSGAARKPRTAPDQYHPPERPGPALPPQDLPLARLIRQRRSAVSFDGQTPLPLDPFLALLDALLPRRGIAPWDALPWEPVVHPVLFVHRVEDLSPGLYLLPRCPSAGPRLRSALGPDLAWERPARLPRHLELIRLLEGDLGRPAKLAACHQDIAADSAFSVAMLADFDRTLSQGAHWYRHLFWECGMLGQVLYLEAEAAGVRGTGIGCFFDDLVHRMLGLADTAWQDLYHFTVGTPVEDRRLESHPPYAHLRERAGGGRDGRTESQAW